MKLTGTMRLPFIVLTPACVTLGIATAVAAGVSPAWWEIVMVIVGATLAHIGVNVFNEHQDFKSGLDAATKRTPFSGGSGTLQKYPELATAAFALAIAATTFAAAFGLYFVLSGRLLLLAVGGLGVLAITLYTPWIVRNPVACLLAPGFGFGTCMVVGSHIALGAPLAWAPVVASFIPFFLVSNLLLLNQFPDIEPDRTVGRKNILIAYGLRSGIIVYGVFLGLAYLAIGLGAIGGLFPRLSLIGLATIPLAILVFKAVLAHQNEVDKLVPSLGLNVIIVLVTPALTAIGIFAA